MESTSNKVKQLLLVDKKRPYEVARLLNVTYGTVYYHMKQLGIPRRKLRFDPAAHPAIGARKHGESIGQERSPEYLAYLGAKKRCNNPNDQSYEDYGGRGIRFLFISFEQFLADVGRRPSRQHSLDRKNNNGHYEPGNMRWATMTQQLKNRRKMQTPRQLRKEIKALQVQAAELKELKQYLSDANVSVMDLIDQGATARYFRESRI